MGASVALENLGKKFRNAAEPSLTDLSLSIEPGETVCIVGPSGCGKSTTLRLVAGLEHPDSGRILIDGRDMTGVAPQARDVAMVFQGFSLYPHMTVRQNLSFPLEMRKMARAEVSRAVERVSDMLGIEKLLGRKPAELSGGERQRVAMGRAIVRRPKVFLFDEPLSNLDAALRAELRGELGRLLRSLDATALYVTHDQAEAMTLGHRVALMRKGRLVQLDEPQKLYKAPSTTFSAAFFGAPPMNLVPVRALAGYSHIDTCPWRPPYRQHPPGCSCFRCRIETSNGADAELILGIRPEHVRILSQSDSGDALAGQIVGLEALGAETHIDVHVNGVVVRARHPGFASFDLGQTIRIAFEPAHLHWFDAATERAL